MSGTEWLFVIGTLTLVNLATLAFNLKLYTEMFKQAAQQARNSKAG